MKPDIKTLFLLPVLVAGFGLISTSRVTAQTIANLYSFTAVAYNSSINASTNSDGAEPFAGLLLSGNTLYGTASNGGTNGNGTVFALNTDGTGFTTLHTFTALSFPYPGTNSDGANPYAGLILSGDTLYGTAQFGGTNGEGTVFALNTNGTGFTTLHTFTGVSDGANPSAGLVLSGSTLYGTAQRDGINGDGTVGNGTVFALNINGSNFTTLHTFTGYITYVTNGDGALPTGGLILSGNTLYGTAYGGGTHGSGTVFALNTDGTGFTNLYSFTADFNGNNDGAAPYAGLILSGNMLYGTARAGGTNDDGTVFAVTTNGTGFTTLHTFTADVSGDNDGADPFAGLVLSGNTLFGTAGSGGDSDDDGTVFAVTTDGTGFTTLHTFTSTPDGGSPRAGLILSGNTLYGTALVGGTNGYGMVFSLSLPGPQLTITPAGTSITLSWPTNPPGFYLQYNVKNLADPSGWVRYTIMTPPVIVNGQFVLTLPITSDQQFYYRLSSQ